MITWDPFFRWQTSKHWTTWHTLSHCVPWCVKCKCPQSLISLSLSSNPVQSTSPTTPSCMPCSMMAKWQNTYWSGICILKARCDRMRRTVSLMLTVCMCSNLRRLMSVVINVPAGKRKNTRFYIYQWLSRKLKLNTVLSNEFAEHQLSAYDDYNL